MGKKKVKTMIEFESILNHYLVNNIPLSIMDDLYDLNLRQRGFMLNRVYDYSAKEDIIGDVMMTSDTNEVSSQYLLMTHNITEETPVSYEEQKALFKEKEDIEKRLAIIEQEVTLDELPFIKDINQKLSKFDDNEIQIAKSIQDILQDKIDLDDNLNENKKVVDEEEVLKEIKKQFNLDDERLEYYTKLYANYNSLLTSKNEFVQNIASKNIKEYDKLKLRYHELLDIIVKKNVKLANWVVRKYFKYVPAEMEEMQAFALEGLVMAINTYDYKLGYRFSSLATIIIKHKIQRHFKLLTGITWDNYICVVKYNQSVNTYQEVMETDEIPSVQDLYYSNLFGLSYEELKLGEIFSKFLSLPFSTILPFDPLDKRSKRNEMLKTMEDYQEEDKYEDDANNKLGLVTTFEDELSLAEINSLRANIEEVLSTLTAREALVLRMRYGLDDGEAKTLDQVAHSFNLTRERIRQIEAKALRKLRHPSRARKIDIYRDEKIHHISEPLFPLWVESLKRGSTERILSMMLLDFIELGDFCQKPTTAMASRYGLYSYDINKLEAYINSLVKITDILAKYNSYANIFDLRREVEKETKINLPVNFYLEYFHKVANISATRNSLL